jgi:hypothetical protein
MDVAEWLAAARADGVRRGLEALVPLLEGLASSTSALRSAEMEEQRPGDSERVEPEER